MRPIEEMVPISVDSIRFCRSALVRLSSSIVLWYSWLMVVSSSLMDWISSRLVSQFLAAAFCSSLMGPEFFVQSLQFGHGLVMRRGRGLEPFPGPPQFLLEAGAVTLLLRSEDNDRIRGRGSLSEDDQRETGPLRLPPPADAPARSPAAGRQRLPGPPRGWWRAPSRRPGAARCGAPAAARPAPRSIRLVLGLSLAQVRKRPAPADRCTTFRRSSTTALAGAYCSSMRSAAHAPKENLCLGGSLVAVAAARSTGCRCGPPDRPPTAARSTRYGEALRR